MWIRPALNALVYVWIPCLVYECKRRSGIYTLYSTYIHVTSSPVVTGSVFMQSMYLLMHARNVNYLDYKLINNKAFTQAMEQILFQVEPFEKW